MGMTPDGCWSARGMRGAVAAGSEHAVNAALDVLREGGNAADAAVAATFSLAVSDYGMFAFGGEAAGLYYCAAEGRTYEISGVGGAPASQDAILWYQKNGIPDEGSLLAAPPPGAPGFCLTVLERFGRFRLKQVVSPTIALLAQDHKNWHAALKRTLLLLIDAEAQGGPGRETGIQSAIKRFYQGDLSEALCRYYSENGHFITASDMAAHQTLIGQPLAASFGGLNVFKCGPWTQGPVLLQTLLLLEKIGIDRYAWLSADATHLALEALKLALADRDRYYADPRMTDVPMAALLSAEYTDLRAGLINPLRASRDFRPGDPDRMRALAPVLQVAGGWDGGTTVCVVADHEGNMAAFTPSANPPYAICESLGIAHGNRLRCMNTMPGHPNHVEPGKRPRITLSPTLWFRDGRPAGAMSVAGGDLQDQTALCCFLSHLLGGMPPEAAVLAPRFMTGHHENSFRSTSCREDARIGAGTATIEESLRSQIGMDLADRGHHLNFDSGPLARPVMLVFGHNGEIKVAGDPRCGYYAAAF